MIPKWTPWAENALLHEAFAPRDASVVSPVIARLGLADVRAFGLTWDDCEQFLAQLGFSARGEIAPKSHATVRESSVKRYGK